MNRQMKPVHPGAILREDILKEMNLSITDAAKGLAISRKHLSALVNEQSSISAEMAVRLDQAFGVEAAFWLDLQKNMTCGKFRKKIKFIFIGSELENFENCVAYNLRNLTKKNKILFHLLISIL